ncbi:hypothetical protein KUTeg_025055 [Tegillarca granosa]|uniref:B box-type domain-containing protein n=1 Tax=Tegillarca granosa TaxID=220873 RepID=A0ABQ9DZM7_TEGGR|nr:hypothetical protein KUTeg_025055 [Tegillarca granosa]
MASGNTNAQVPISKCEVCDRGVDARFYCQECTQEMCKDCQKSHLRMVMAKNHTIIRIATDKDTSVHQQESCKIPCQTHPKETVQMYCLTCTLPICHTCIAEKTHTNHDLDKLVNIAEKYKKYLAQFISKTKQDISDHQTSLQSIQNNIQDYTEHADKTISDINKQREQIKSEADKVADDMIREVEHRKFKDVTTMKEKGDKIKKFISDDKELLGPCEEKVHSDTDTCVKDFKTVLSYKKNKTTFSVTPLRPPIFVRNDVHGLQDIFGTLKDQTEKIRVVGGLKYNPYGEPIQKLDYKIAPVGTSVNIGTVPTPAGTSVDISTDVISNIKLGINGTSVCAVSDKESWCGSGFGVGKDLVLIQTNGTIKKKVNLDNSLYDITVTSSGDVIFTEWKGHTIRKYSSDKVTIVANNLSPYQTQGLCVTSEQDILVCLYNEKNDKVVRMSLNGQIKQTIQYNKQNKPLFSDPKLVTENINGDICVVDDYRTVVVVNKDGQFSLKYPESGKSTHTIGDCSGIACDKLGYILISDYVNSQVHQIDSDGKFVQFVLTEQHGIEKPLGLSIDNKGQLWVCYKNGTEVRVYKYRS